MQASVYVKRNLDKLYQVGYSSIEIQKLKTN